MSQKFQLIKLERSGPQTTLILNRPPLNVINIAMIDEIICALEEISSDAGTRLLIIRGEGRCFSAGMDVADHLPDKVHKMLDEMHNLLTRLADLEIPVISVLHGMAFGGGLEIAMMADFVYAESGCKIGQPEIQLGVFPPAAIAFYSDWFGIGVAKDLVMTGRTFTSDEALRKNLVNDVFSVEELETRVQQIADTLLSRSRAALASAKRAFHKTKDTTSWDDLKSAERIYLEELMSTEDAVEGLQAFLQKRQPHWKHR
jgi:cyclohexa-1,5-dienecarbonyl-CoA hydratase